jgi:hypothetical protein
VTKFKRLGTTAKNQNFIHEELRINFRDDSYHNVQSLVFSCIFHPADGGSRFHRNAGNFSNKLQEVITQNPQQDYFLLTNHLHLQQSLYEPTNKGVTDRHLRNRRSGPVWRQSMCTRATQFAVRCTLIGQTLGLRTKNSFKNLSSFIAASWELPNFISVRKKTVLEM